MYPRNAASPERLSIGAVVQISDGAVQTSGVSIKVKPQGTTASAGGGTTSYEEGIVEYIPTQAETNYTSFEVIAYKTGCIPVATTVVTSASATAGHAGVDWGKVINPTTTVGLSGTTVSTVTTATNLTNLPAITAGWLTSAGIDSGALDGKGNWNIGKTGYSLTATTGLGNQTADITGNLSGSVGSVTTVSDKTGYSLTTAPPTVEAIADGFLDRDMSTGTDSGSDSVRTPRQALYALRNKWTNIAGTYTVYKTNDTTVSWTSALSTDPAGEAIVGSDPA